MKKHLGKNLSFIRLMYKIHRLDWTFKFHTTCSSQENTYIYLFGSAVTRFAQRVIAKLNVPCAVDLLNDRRIVADHRIDDILIRQQGMRNVFQNSRSRRFPQFTESLPSQSL